MTTVNVDEAKTYLSRLNEAGLEGEPFIIAEAGKPLVKVEASNAPAPVVPDRLGFIASEFKMPEGFDATGGVAQRPAPAAIASGWLARRSHRTGTRSSRRGGVTHCAPDSHALT